MRLLVLVSTVILAALVLLRVPPEGRDLWYYVTGAVLFVDIGLLAMTEDER